MSGHAPTYILDGYNILCELVPEEGLARGLERARGLLEARLRAFLRSQAVRPRIILVYDGAAGGGHVTERSGGLEVRFARPPREADDVILELCRELEGDRHVRVVTSDRDILRPLPGLRIPHWTSREFVRRLAALGEGGGTARRGSRGRGDERHGDEKPRGVSGREAEGWVDEFGFGEHPAGREAEP